MPTIDVILKFIGEVVLYGGGSAACAYLLFQFLGKSWIENKFAQRLEAYKHQQQLELQHLKVEIESMLSGALKMQEREFQVLPEAWKKLDDAFGTTNWATSVLQQYPDVDRMADDELEEFLDKSELLESQKTRVRADSRPQRGKTYQNIIFWHRISKAKQANADLQAFIAANGIFLPASMRKQFSDMIPLLWDAVSCSETGHEAGDYKLKTQGWRALKDKGEPLYKAIESEIQGRLHSHSGRQ